jgi:hypothetical protein
MSEIKTKGQEMTADVCALLRARNPLLWIVTREEARVERHLAEAAQAAKFVLRTWDVAQGICNADGTVEVQDSADPGVALATIRTRALAGTDRGLWVMRDLPVWLAGTPGAAPARMLRNLARLLPGTKVEAAQAVVVLSPSGEVPPELAGHATVIEWPLPDRAEIASILDVLIEQYGLQDMLRNGARDAAVDAAVGLSGEEAQACYARSLVQLRKIDPALVASEKRRVIARERVLEWFDPLPGGLDSVGGLQNLKNWLRARSTAYSPEARAYGLPAPKGALLVGVSGCGKSLTAKAIATAWGVPLLRLDLGALKSKFVGESEGNLRKAFKVIEAIGRCVLWVDEIEKALAGATQGAADGGVSADALGAVLSWMQERQGQAFIIATANDVSALPPELLRKGRFDEVFFVDLPIASERGEILGAALRQHGRNLATMVESNAGLEKIVQATAGFTGSEVAEIVPDALFRAFGDKGREIAAADLLAAAQTVVPLSKTAKEKIDALRRWADGRARPANVAERAVAMPGKIRALDI